jgi:hypothetical protein
MPLLQVPVKLKICVKSLLTWRYAQVIDAVDIHLMLEPFSAACEHGILIAASFIGTYVRPKILENMALPSSGSLYVSDTPVADVAIERQTL